MTLQVVDDLVTRARTGNQVDMRKTKSLVSKIMVFFAHFHAE